MTAPTFAPLGEWLTAVEAMNPDDAADALWFRCRYDLGLFALTYFPERFSAPFNAMHRDFLGREKVAWSERSAQSRSVDAAPRGGAKSTIDSFASLVHDVCYGLEAFVAVFSTTYRLSEGLIKDLHAVFTNPDRYPDLHEDHGPFTVVGGQTDFVVSCPEGNAQGTRVAAFSLGGSIRGEKHAGIRPTKLLIDDGDHPEKVRSPDQRAKLWDFVTKDVMKAGGPYSQFRTIGTVLHPDSMLARLLKAPAWQSMTWRSVIEWPDRMDLWQDCRRIWADLANPDRVADAQAFYAEHRAAMDAGAVVLWPEYEPLWDLMVLLWSDGESAFASEKQNDPRDPTRQVFDLDALRRCRFDGEFITSADGRSIRLNACTVAVWLDPAIGEAMGNDYSALAMVARDEVGYRYLLRCSQRHEPPSKQRARVWSVFDQIGPRAKYGIEDNGFQVMYGADFERERAERRQSGQTWNLAIRGYTSTQNKAERISRLEPDVVNGWVQVAEDIPREFIDQLRDFPSGAHDDGLDAWERADWLACGGGMSAPTVGWL